MELGRVISSLLSLGTKLLPAINEFSLQVPSSSSPAESHQIKTELKELMRLLEQIKATLYDAEERDIRDLSVKLWFKELREVAYNAEDVLDEYNYEILRAQVEEQDASPSDSRKRKQIQDGMLDQIQQIRNKFSEIAKDRVALQLLDEYGPRRRNNDMQIVPTSHFVIESDIIGREREKKELLDLLSFESQDDKIISVVAVVGTGGIGKTTLAQLIYNDHKIRQKFDKFGWVWVSDNFNVQSLTREVVESITRKSCCLANFSALQENISEEIRGKKIFLVLDDVWNESRSHWESFQIPFMSASLVKILVTTRNKHVARIMQTVPTFNLDYMSEQQCWQIFVHYAFGQVIQNTSSNLLEIGKQIVQKCGRLPLAVKSIARILRHESKEESWREILESELWESHASNEIFQHLQISYSRLPTYLKPCFLYCSMFPRDYCYNVEELVKLWIYQGYVQTNGLKSAEKIGSEYAKQLWQRSFFQGDFENKKIKLTLHGMVHDLARSISGHGCYSIEGNILPNFPEELYHLYVRRCIKILDPSPYPSVKISSLRTLIVDCDAENFLRAFDISKAKKVRALQFCFSIYSNSDFHISFVNFKHLRYLSLCKGHFERLPECICSFYNLQNLALDCCPYLCELPKSFGNLISLEELKISQCDKLKVLPMSFCKLTALRKFRLYKCHQLEELPHDMGKLMNLQYLLIYGTRVSSLPPSLNKKMGGLELHVTLECRGIGWLEDFVDLEGTLILSGLSHVSSLKDVHHANLASMHKLQRLILTWSHARSDISEDFDGNVLVLHIAGCDNEKLRIDLDDEEDSEIDARSIIIRLQPHPNLKELHIECYPDLFQTRLEMLPYMH
ncbi:Disease resistance protein RGA2 [Rhynchospora pubera]|uniref:Disease resistance protein RGA2 n=1 Tax=Rhynchospora pubera TaxID=906938 RepID=A0AAV8FV93_9POAL|nr:Disease resistance protein RGA2 [Rhynchospora pubera]